MWWETEENCASYECLKVEALQWKIKKNILSTIYGRAAMWCEIEEKIVQVISVWRWKHCGVRQRGNMLLYYERKVMWCGIEMKNVQDAFQDRLCDVRL